MQAVKSGSNHSSSSSMEAAQLVYSVGYLAFSYFFVLFYFIFADTEVICGVHYNTPSMAIHTTAQTLIRKR